MRSLISFVAVLIIKCVYSEVNSDYEIWLEGRNITSNLTSNADQNETICTSDLIKINKRMEELNLAKIQCALNLKSLIADNIGLSIITNESINMLPTSVQNVSLTRNDLGKINSDVFTNSTINNLNLSSNRIEIIAPDAFNNMKNLTSIILDHNEIATYNITFMDCPKLKLISIKFNFIKQLSEGILKQLKQNVLKIFFSYNTIRDVHKSALDVKQFQEVHLDHNELKNAQLLIKLVKAEIVDLSENHITCLPKEFMENGLSKIKLLNLTGNPLECNCLQDLQRKMRKNIEFQKMSPLVQNINIILPKNKTKNC